LIIPLGMTRIGKNMLEPILTVLYYILYDICLILFFFGVNISHHFFLSISKELRLYNVFIYIHMNLLCYKIPSLFESELICLFV